MSAGFIILSIIIVFFFGASVYSFLNVLVCRIPKKEDFIKARSHCVKCGRTLGPAELVPIVSYVCLGGKCKDCGVKIGIRDVSIEVMGGLLAVICAVFYFLDPLKGLTVFAFFGMLSVIALIDIDTMKVENGTLIALLVIALISIVTMPEIALLDRAIGAVCISIPMLVLSFLIPGAFGGGDVKLMVVAGIFLGWKLVILSFMAASILGGLFGIVLLGTKKKGKKDRFVFCPFLCIGVAASILLGTRYVLPYLPF